MKLHLAKSLRAALLACVCGAMVSTTWAAEIYDTGVVNGDSTLTLQGGDYGTNITGTGNLTITGSGNLRNASAEQSINHTGTLTLAANGNTVETGGWSSSAVPATIGSNVTDVIIESGKLKLTCASKLLNSGSLSIASGAELWAIDNTTVQFNEKFTNNAGKLTLQNNTAVLAAGVLETLDFTTTTNETPTYSRNGTSGFLNTGITTYTLVDCTEKGGTLQFDNAKIKLTDGTTAALVASGTKGTFDIAVNDGTFYVNDDLSITSVEQSSATKIEVAAGKTLTVASGTCDDLNKNVSLAEGSTLNLQNRSAMNNVEITLAGDAAIHMQGTSMRADVSGTGNLTLKQVSNEGWVKGEINNSGTVTIDGHVVLHNDGDVGTIGSAVTSVIVGTGDTLEIYNGQENEFDLNMSGGQILINNDSTMVVTADSTITGGTFTVRSGSTLDLSNVKTLNASELDLNAGSKLILGEGPLTFTGTLKVADGAIIDLSSWDTNVYDFWYEELFTGGTTLETSGEGFVQIYFGGGDTVLWPNWLITDDAKPGSVYAIPEPTTATLSLLALAGLAARRRRK